LKSENIIEAQNYSKCNVVNVFIPTFHLPTSRKVQYLVQNL